ncbi:MAG: ATP synthase F1 subunit epsilon [bacterium]|nr:ATP synthase F1 subunit epsilon [bacterium]
MLEFELITPERKVFHLRVNQVTIPTTEGEVTILPNHVSLVAEITPGIVHLKNGNEEEEVAIAGGFLQVSADGRVRVLADFAERGHELDLSVIEEAKKRATQIMQETIHLNDESFARAAAALEREFARERLALRIQRRGRAFTIPTPIQTK